MSSAEPMRGFSLSGQPSAERAHPAQAIIARLCKATRCSSLCLVLLALLNACATSPPAHMNDGCTIFSEKAAWYKATKQAERKWGVPVSVQLAIIYQESRFRYDAKAPRDYVLGAIPWGRKSSAYGYGQVLDGTWRSYQNATGRLVASRDDFADVTDFIGWYLNGFHQRLGISRHDAYRLYLAYHEGEGGYRRRTYHHKRWLLNVAAKVAQRARRYARQLRRCN